MTRRLGRVVALALVCAFATATPAFAAGHHAKHHRHSVQHHHHKHRGAAHRHHRQHRHHVAKRRHVERQAVAHDARFGSAALPDGGSFNGLVAAARASLGETAYQLGVRRTLWCMAAVNKWLQQTGHSPSGSDVAKSALALGPHVSTPQVGSLAVMGRGKNPENGHVGVVSGVTPDGNPIVISGNHNRRVAESVYPRRRIIAYVLPR